MTLYDRVPYDRHPCAPSHPAHVAAVATLLGRAPADPRRCRVLETSSERLAQALRALVDAAPRPVPFQSLPGADRDLAEELLALVAQGQVSLSATSRRIAAAGEPGAPFSVALDQLEQGRTSVTNLWHATVPRALAARAFWM